MEREGKRRCVWLKRQEFSIFTLPDDPRQDVQDYIRVYIAGAHQTPPKFSEMVGDTVPLFRFLSFYLLRRPEV